MRVVELDELRVRGIRLIALCSWVCAASLGLGIALNAISGGWTIVLLAALLNIVPTRMALAQRGDHVARLVVGVLAAAHPALLVYALQGHQWQMDMHMFFFVALAALTILCDWRPLALATVLVAVHHLLLSFLASAWVFSGSGNVGRVMIHAAAVLLEFAVLAYITHRMRQLLVTQGQARAISETLARDARTAMTDAREAQRAAEQALAAAAEADGRAADERRRREHLESVAAEQRTRDLLALSAQFESSVHAVVTSVGSAASELESASSALSELANDSGRQSAAVAERATGASLAARALSLIHI